MLGLAILIGLWLIFRYAIGNAQKTGHDSALDILKKRLARGEITEEEYKEKKRTIEQS